MQYVGFDVHKRCTCYTQMNAMGEIQRQGRLKNTPEALAAFFASIDDAAPVALAAPPLVPSLRSPREPPHLCDSRASAAHSSKCGSESQNG
jgi:hypothetical protein